MSPLSGSATESPDSPAHSIPGSLAPAPFGLTMLVSPAAQSRPEAPAGTSIASGKVLEITWAEVFGGACGCCWGDIRFRLCCDDTIELVETCWEAEFGSSILPGPGGLRMGPG